MNPTFYSKEDLEKVRESINKILLYIKVPVIFVGGLANKVQFPEFYAGQQIPPINDIDFVFSYESIGSQTVSEDISKYFYITHIYKENTGFYFAVVDKNSFIKFDLFASNERKVLTQNIKFLDHKFDVYIPEEVFFKNARDIYNFLGNDKKLPSKHVNLFKYLDSVITNEDLSKIWPLEFSILKQIKGFEFSNLEEYKAILNELIMQKNELIYEDKGFLGYDKYPTHCLENQPWGIKIEDEETFDYVVSEMKKRW